MPEINKEYLLYGVIVLGVAYLLVMYIMQRVKSASHQKAIVKAKTAYDEARNNQKEEREKIVENIIEVYGYESGKKVRNGELWVGMPIHLLLLAKGKANSIRQSVDTNTITQTWIYTQGEGKKASSKDIEVIIRNNQVHSWNVAI